MHILLRFNLQAGCVQLFILRRHVKVASIRDERDEIHQVSTVSNNIDSIERYWFTFVSCTEQSFRNNALTLKLYLSIYSKQCRKNINEIEIEITNRIIKRLFLCNRQYIFLYFEIYEYSN